MSSDVISIFSTIITIISMIVTILYANKAQNIQKEIELDIGRLVILESRDLVVKALSYARELLDLPNELGNSRGKKHISIIRGLQEVIDTLIHKFGQQSVDMEFNQKLNSCSEILQELRGLNPKDKEFLKNSHRIHKLLQECYKKCANIIVKRG